MPIYEYECFNCRLKFEYLVRSSNEAIVCPQCQEKKLRKLISSFAFSAKDAQGNTTANSSSGCSGCAKGNCSSCGR